jgi:hypothetical protein
VALGFALCTRLCESVCVCVLTCPAIDPVLALSVVSGCCSLADFDVTGGAVFNVSGATSRVVLGCGGLDSESVCITVDILQPNTAYTFRVAAVYEQGDDALFYFPGRPSIAVQLTLPCWRHGCLMWLLLWWWWWWGRQEHLQ